MAAFTIGLLLVIGAIVYTAVEAQRNDVKICQGQNEIRGTIRLQISEQARILPTIEYYQTHPAELERALKDNAESIHRFDAIPCKDPPFSDLWLFGGG